MLHLHFCQTKYRPALPKQGGKLPNDTKALNKHIVSFSEQLRKRNTRSTLAVIFMHNFKEVQYECKEITIRILESASLPGIKWTWKEAL